MQEIPGSILGVIIFVLQPLLNEVRFLWLRLETELFLCRVEREDINATTDREGLLYPPKVFSKIDHEPRCIIMLYQIISLGGACSSTVGMLWQPLSSLILP